eukprot:9483138-Pyramimonas_sp.AAC.1
MLTLEKPPPTLDDTPTRHYSKALNHLAPADWPLSHLAPDDWPLSHLAPADWPQGHGGAMPTEGPPAAPDGGPPAGAQVPEGGQKEGVFGEDASGGPAGAGTAHRHHEDGVQQPERGQGAGEVRRC